MGKIISRGLAPRDDPMFTGGVETFSVRKSKKPLASSSGFTIGATLDILASLSNDVTDYPDEPEDDEGAS